MSEREAQLEVVGIRFFEKQGTCLFGSVRMCCDVDLFGKRTALTMKSIVSRESASQNVISNTCCQAIVRDLSRTLKSKVMREEDVIVRGVVYTLREPDAHSTGQSWNIEIWKS